MIARYLKCDNPSCQHECGPIAARYEDADVLDAAMVLLWECDVDGDYCPKCAAERQRHRENTGPCEGEKGV